jgi:hypothetical protein
MQRRHALRNINRSGASCSAYLREHPLLALMSAPNLRGVDIVGQRGARVTQLHAPR